MRRAQLLPHDFHPSRAKFGSPAWLSGYAVLRRGRLILLALFLSLAAVATVQRGVLTRSHATFPIFRQSFVHLRAGQDLYARYPAEQGTEDRDRFKYSPTAALFFAPFALVPFVAGLLLWTVLNALAIYFAVDRLLPGREGTVALLILFPSLIAAIQSTSSNALIAALMVLSFVAMEKQKITGASTAIAAGMLMKLFPAAAAPFLFTQPRPWRAIGKFSVVVALLLAAPLLVTSPSELAMQYRSWAAIVFADERDLSFARSIMVVIRAWTHSEVPNGVFQAIATAILVLPLAVRRSAWTDPEFRQRFFGSLAIFVVIFNHQAENASYVIAAVGLAVWFLKSEKTLARIFLLALCVAGLEAIPYTIVWLWLQFDLWDGGRLLDWAMARWPRAEEFAPQRLGLLRLPVVKGWAVAQGKAIHEITAIQRGGFRQACQAARAGRLAGRVVGAGRGNLTPKAVHVQVHLGRQQTHPVALGIQAAVQRRVQHRQRAPQGGAAIRTVGFRPEKRRQRLASLIGAGQGQVSQ